MSIGEKYELLIPEATTMEEQERAMIQTIAEDIVADLTLLGDIPFVMEFEERDPTKTAATWSMILFRRPKDEAKIAGLFYARRATSIDVVAAGVCALLRGDSAVLSRVEDQLRKCADLCHVTGGLNVNSCLLLKQFQSRLARRKGDKNDNC